MLVVFVSSVCGERESGEKYLVRKETLEWIQVGFDEQLVQITTNYKQSKFASIGKLDLVAKSNIKVPLSFFSNKVLPLFYFVSQKERRRDLQERCF